MLNKDRLILETYERKN